MRDISLYTLTKERYRELLYFCRQYKDWRSELASTEDALQSPNLSGMPRSGKISDTTGNLAVTRASLSHKCKMIDDSAKEASEELAEAIIKSVTEPLKEKPSRELAAARRIFFYNLDKKRR